ncbi:protein of unknown function [Ruminococcaceae bacterium BL-4]|nr:protein of unknown function [Ruminococcaceae bacterium BL-4]
MKPRNFWEFYARLFFILGGSFLLIGLLSQAGIMKMKPGAHSDPRVFAIIGCLFLIVAGLSQFMGAYMVKRDKLLLQTGTPISGTIVSVKQLQFTRFSTSYPYVVYFTYEWEGMQYKGRIGPLWSIPSLKENDNGTIYIDAENPKHSTLKL